MLGAIIERFGTDYAKTNTHIRYNCPFCANRRGKIDDDKKLYVDKKTGMFYCFKCHAKGKINNQIDVKSCSDIYKKILDFANDMCYSKEEQNEIDSDIDEDDEDNCFYLPDVKIKKDTLAYKYCLERGITDDMINFYHIRLGVGDLFGRIVIPNVLYGNEWTDMYSARSYLKQEPKYLNPPDCDKSKIVFNIDNIMEGADDIYVVEGVLTAIAAGKEAVAVYGCHPSDIQINKILSKKCKNIYCVLDNDEAGRPANEQLANNLKKLTENTNTQVYIVYMPEGIDAADIGENAFKEYVRNNFKPVYNSVYAKLISFTNKTKLI